MCNNYLLLLQYNNWFINVGGKSAANTVLSIVVAHVQIVITHAHDMNNTHQLLRNIMDNIVLYYIIHGNMTHTIVNRLRRFTTKYAKKSCGWRQRAEDQQKAGL